MAPTTPERPRRVKHEYSPHTRTRIVTKYAQGVSSTIVGREFGISAGAVRQMALRYRVQKSGKSRPRSGRPHKINSRDESHILRIVRSNPFATNKEIREQAGLECGETCLRKWLSEHGINHYPALLRPRLTPERAANRLAFAKRYVDKPLEWWYRVVFSDKSTMQRGQGARRLWVWCKKDERLNPEHVQTYDPHTRHGRQFWAAFTAARRTALTPLQGNPNAPRGGVDRFVIRTMLEEQLPTICEPGSIFMQDNAPVHKAKHVQDWLQEWAGENGVELLDWPAWSPDLNPIENLWKVWKQRIAEKYPELATLKTNEESLRRLERAACDIWEDLERDMLKKLVESMPKRLQAVIDAKGWYTKY